MFKKESESEIGTRLYCAGVLYKFATTRKKEIPILIDNSIRL